ncbi:kinase-like protein [Athelia psychrophila]|uniref:Kinase-like protein n=1 Tax=Athelia psychrophila TaxID=1759441 RepID=A0A165X4I5_9AGAM|nr:kinase-like protein [Fibularhizoctonia sp. CBS 109695]
MLLARMDQPHNPRPSEPLKDQIAFNRVIFDSATRSLTEVRVMVEMAHKMMENQTLRSSKDLLKTLTSLKQILRLTDLALRAYQDTPLVKHLGSLISLGAGDCYQLLEDLIANLSNYLSILSPAVFYFIRKYIWVGIPQGARARMIESKLRECHRSFAVCLLALGSAAWPGLQPGLKEALTELADVYVLLVQESKSLRHINVEAVIVIDHLGRTLPVPAIFCNSAQHFHTVIAGFCKGAAGDILVQRRDYRILKSDSNQVIDPLDFHTALQSGMTYAMTIVLRRKTQEGRVNEEHKCPNCNLANRKAITVSGWVICQWCQCDFQISSEDGGMTSPRISQAETTTPPDERSSFRRICILQDDMRMNEVNTAENGAPENLEDRRESESTEKQDDLGEEEDSAAERPYKHHYVPLPSRYTIQQLTPNLNLLDITGYVRRDPEHPHPIGSGAAGVVHRGLYEWTDPQTMQTIRMKVAVKHILPSSGISHQTEQRIRREAATWRYLKHPNVNQFLGIAQMEPNRPPALVTRFLYRNMFLDYIGRHPELKMQMALDIARGLQYLHSQDTPVIHGDIKPDNILISDNGAAQLNDFGTSQTLDFQGFTTKAWRNMRYTAPEILPMIETPIEPRPTMQSDIFSLGMLFLVLFDHRSNMEVRIRIPYNHIRLVNDIGTSEVKLLKRIHAGERPMRDRYPRIESDGIWNMVTACWQGHPMQRPNINQVAQTEAYW